MFSDKYKLMVLIFLSISFLVYSFYLYKEPSCEKENTTALEMEGKMIWQKKNCTSCHQLYGLGGHLGPDLTNITARRTTPQIEAFLKNGINQMPNFNLSQHEMDALISFLTAVNKSGSGDPRTYKLHIDGTISQ